MARRLRIGIDATSEDPRRPAGALDYYRKLVAELLELDGDIDYLLFIGRRGAHLFPDAPRLTKVRLPFSNEARIRRVLSYHLAVPPLAKFHRLDLLNTGNIAPWWSGCNVVSKNMTMHAFTVPDAVPAITRRYRRALGRRTARRAKLIISNSESNTRDIVHHLQVDRARIRVIPEAVDHDIFRPLPDPKAAEALLARLDIRPPFVLFVSSLWPYKNADGLAHAFAKAGDHLSGHQLVYVGFERERAISTQLHQRVDDLGIADRVRMTGGLPQADVALLYHAADMFVFPSRYETFGKPVVEAMACGCPVIASDASSIPEVAGDAAMLVDPSDSDEMAQAMVRVATDQALRATLKTRGFRQAGTFTWPDIARRTLDVFREAIEAGTGVRDPGVVD